LVREDHQIGGLHPRDGARESPPTRDAPA
jgi:hypothetical protein